jgi:hypothetical protein
LPKNSKEKIVRKIHPGDFKNNFKNLSWDVALKFECSLTSAGPFSYLHILLHVSQTN